jgi:hypothetical protein
MDLCLKEITKLVKDIEKRKSENLGGLRRFLNTSKYLLKSTNLNRKMSGTYAYLSFSKHRKVVKN